MGKIVCLMGKSSTGKDTIYKRILEKAELCLSTIVPYTTRPMREGETEGVEYHFTDEEGFRALQGAGKVIEDRAYQTFHGLWRYFTVDDGQICLKEKNYIGKAMYSLQLKKKNEKGYLCFGGYDKTEINETLYKNMTFTNIWYNDIEKDNFAEWFIPIKYLYIKAGNKTNNITFAQKIILNTSIDKILIPKNFYLQYMNVIFSDDKLCEIQKDNRLHCKCDAKYERNFPTFYFHYENSNIFRSSFKVTPSDYIIMDSSKRESESNVNCILQMSMNYKGNYCTL